MGHLSTLVKYINLREDPGLGKGLSSQTSYISAPRLCCSGSPFLWRETSGSGTARLTGTSPSTSGRTSSLGSTESEFYRRKLSVELTDHLQMVQQVLL